MKTDTTSPDSTGHNQDQELRELLESIARTGKPFIPLLNEAITLRLLQEAFRELYREDKSVESFEPWHKLATRQLKARLDTALERKLSPEEEQERIWDIFFVPEEERVKRRLRNREADHARQKSTHCDSL